MAYLLIGVCTFISFLRLFYHLAINYLFYLIIFIKVKSLAQTVRAFSKLFMRPAKASGELSLPHLSNLAALSQASIPPGKSRKSLYFKPTYCNYLWNLSKSSRWNTCPSIFPRLRLKLRPVGKSLFLPAIFHRRTEIQKNYVPCKII